MPCGRLFLAKKAKKKRKKNIMGKKMENNIKNKKLCKLFQGLAPGTPCLGNIAGDARLASSAVIARGPAANAARGKSKNPQKKCPTKCNMSIFVLSIHCDLHHLPCMKINEHTLPISLCSLWPLFFLCVKTKKPSQTLQTDNIYPIQTNII